VAMHDSVLVQKLDELLRRDGETHKNLDHRFTPTSRTKL
jgi:hypothetical protein